MEPDVSTLRTPLLSVDDEEQLRPEDHLADEDHKNNDATEEAIENEAENDNDNEDGDDTEENEILIWIQKALHTTLLPDGPIGAIDPSTNPPITDGQVQGEGEGSSSSSSSSSSFPPLMENKFSIKLIKFIIFTFGSIFFLRWLVSTLRQNHQDVHLKYWHLWVFDGDLIVRDTIAFFLVGRLWESNRLGIDHLAWIIMVILANVYYESQHYIPYLRYSATLYQMHCIWPWQLWIFVILFLLPVSVFVIVAHVRYACNRNNNNNASNGNQLLLKIFEICICGIFFLAPVISSPYFHFHHWFAGWFIGMHCNYNTWWSRATMAWCWGMYINGIAVYGRDPVLTCDYAQFLTIDNRCPFGSIERDNDMMTMEFEDHDEYYFANQNNNLLCTFNENNDMIDSAYNFTSIGTMLKEGTMWFTTIIQQQRYHHQQGQQEESSFIEDMEPADWRNCSSNGYHP